MTDLTQISETFETTQNQATPTEILARHFRTQYRIFSGRKRTSPLTTDDKAYVAGIKSLLDTLSTGYDGRTAVLECKAEGSDDVLTVNISHPGRQRTVRLRIANIVPGKYDADVSFSNGDGVSKSYMMPQEKTIPKVHGERLANKALDYLVR